MMALITRPASKECSTIDRTAQARSVSTATKGQSSENASVLAVTTPTLNPVKLPGPLVTDIRPIWLGWIPASTNTDRIMGINRLELPGPSKPSSAALFFRKDFASAAAMISPASDIATQWFRPEVSIARLKSVIVLTVGALENLVFAEFSPEILSNIPDLVMGTDQRKYQLISKPSNRFLSRYCHPPRKFQP